MVNTRLIRFSIKWNCWELNCACENDIVIKWHPIRIIWINFCSINETELNACCLWLWWYRLILINYVVYNYVSSISSGKATHQIECLVTRNKFIQHGINTSVTYKSPFSGANTENKQHTTKQRRISHEFKQALKSKYFEIKCNFYVSIWNICKVTEHWCNKFSRIKPFLIQYVGNMWLQIHVSWMEENRKYQQR